MAALAAHPVQCLRYARTLVIGHRPRETGLRASGQACILTWSPAATASLLRTAPGFRPIRGSFPRSFVEEDREQQIRVAEAANVMPCLRLQIEPVARGNLTFASFQFEHRFAFDAV